MVWYGAMLGAKGERSVVGSGEGYGVWEAQREAGPFFQRLCGGPYGAPVFFG